MADPQSLLQPGETLGPPVASSPAPSSSNSLLQPGETLGPAVQPQGAVSNDNQTVDHPIDLLKGMGEEALGTVKGALTEVFPGAHQLYQSLSNLPQNYRDYEVARQSGKSPIQAANEVAAKEEQKTSMVNALKQRVKEFSDHPNEATGKLIVDLVPMLLTHGAPEAEEATAGAEGTAPEEAASSAAQSAATGDTSLLQPGEMLGEPVTEAPAPGVLKPGYEKVADTNI